MRSSMGSQQPAQAIAVIPGPLTHTGETAAYLIMQVANVRHENFSFPGCHIEVVSVLGVGY